MSILLTAIFTAGRVTNRWCLQYLTVVILNYEVSFEKLHISLNTWRKLTPVTFRASHYSNNIVFKTAFLGIITLVTNERLFRWKVCASIGNTVPLLCLYSQRKGFRSMDHLYETLHGLYQKENTRIRGFQERFIKCPHGDFLDNIQPTGNFIGTVCLYSGGHLSSFSVK